MTRPIIRSRRASTIKIKLAFEVGFTRRERDQY